MKHVGLNVAADPLFTAAYTGVNGGMVLVVADDNGCHSSQNEQDSALLCKKRGSTHAGARVCAGVQGFYEAALMSFQRAVRRAGAAFDPIREFLIPAALSNC